MWEKHSVNLTILLKNAFKSFPSLRQNLPGGYREPDLSCSVVLSLKQKPYELAEYLEQT